MDYVKEAFKRVKEDISFLKSELDDLKKEISQTNNSLNRLYELFNEEKGPNNQTNNSTDRQIIQTNSTNNSTNNNLFKPSKPQNLGISTRNQGVSTDRQTDKQTNRQTDFRENHNNSGSENNKEIFNSEDFNSQKNMNEALDVLNSLDNIKKEIRNKFKRLTNQEMLVFSTIFQLEEEGERVNYKTISNKINLSESSIRDYVLRIINKGIPVEKTKINNKSIHLKISSDLRKIATLNTIVQLRDI
jgi:hypothetical protein